MNPELAPELNWLPEGGEMAQRIRTLDWSKTGLGPAESWSPTLRTVVRFMLANRFPMLLWWGPDYIELYNDAYRPVLGTKHPDALGQPGRECWKEIWHVLKPLVDTPFFGGPATWNDDLFVEINRYGFVEETHFTIAYSAVPDDAAAGGIGGVLATVVETTAKVIGERRLAVLRDLGAHSSDARTREEACRIATSTLQAHAKDIPFAMLYLLDADGTSAHLAGSVGLGADAGIPAHVDLANERVWRLAEVVRKRDLQRVGNLSAYFGAGIPAGPWSDAPHEMVLLPIRSGSAGQLAGVLVAGISARLAFDDLYRDFLALVAGQIATTLANAVAYEAETRRAEALAEIDRAKTAFFSNVSHEFRTPLTLILGPLEEALEHAGQSLPREQVELLHRNTVRLQKLVNTLLDFSRIEAGRIQASYESTDLAQFTAELASVFRSAIEKADMRLIVDCPVLAAPVHVDRDMYEKIVLNLLSNAFKFTLAGEIEVRLREAGDVVELSVRDTGAGIAADQLPHVFERFHRIEGTAARTHEGTGIGLAMVQELAKLHGGKVVVKSQPGVGSTFTVTLPRGHAHLPADRIVAPRPLHATRAAEQFVAQAQQWLPSPQAEGDVVLDISDLVPAQRPRIVLADDNADMREYVARLLTPHYEVEAVADGLAALDAITRLQPDLVLSDVMMPLLDGFGLISSLRADERTQGIPVILLSARAGEEARIEGIQAGANDYLIKPFFARELLARVGAQIEMARLRREHEMLAAADMQEASRRKDEFLATLAHELRNPLAPIRNALHILKMKERQDSRGLHEMLERQVSHMVRLVDDLTEVSRITSGKVELRKERVDLASVMRSAVETSRPLIDAARHWLEVSLPVQPLMVDADPLRLAQIISNLLNNASKYTNNGGVVWLSAWQEYGQAVISVRDNGMGIPAAMLSKVFDLFTQVEHNSSRAQGGLGIGLTLVRRLVELHGGKVEARSDGPGTGCEFVVTLPLQAERRDRPVESAQSRETSAVLRQRILLVDDNRDAAESLGMLLRMLGADVFTVHDGATALESFGTYRPDVVLMDIGMPGMNGHEVARHLRQQPDGDSATLIALTGWSQDEDRQNSLKSGFDHHLVKPVDMDALEQLLTQVPSGSVMH